MKQQFLAVNEQLLKEKEKNRKLKNLYIGSNDKIR